MAARSDDVKELRLALVCYGGVSLAIYMHGVTKEILKLVRASRALDADRAAGTVGDATASVQRAPDWDSEYVYYDALKAIAIGSKPLSVTVDIVGGTSAGGINGVCLARGIAQSRSLDGFRDLWVNEGSILVLIRRHFPNLKALSDVPHELASLRHKISERLHEHGLVGGPLNGNDMVRMLCNAFVGMGRLVEPSPATLLPDGGDIELLVTTTDLEGYDVLVDSGTGGVTNHDKSYRQVLRFAASDPDRGYEGDPAVAALTFAARATSSFPGAFPPVSFGSFRNAIAGAEHPPTYTDDRLLQHFDYGTEYGARPDKAWYVDGGVLDNAPFDHVIEAIATKRSELETARHLIYIQPDPGKAPKPDDGVPLEPSLLKTVHDSLSTIPKHRPTIDALESLRQMNERIAEIGKITATQSDCVIEELVKVLPADATLDMAYDDSVATSDAVRKASVDAAGQTYGTYCRLRADVAAKAFGDGLSANLGYPPESNEAAFLCGVLTAWVHDTTTWDNPEYGDLEQLLTRADVSFRDRRARFIAHGVNDYLAGRDGATPDNWRASLLEMKAACWDLVASLKSTGVDSLDAVTAQADGIFGHAKLAAVLREDPASYATVAKTELDALFASYRDTVAAKVAGTSRKLWDVMTSSTATWEATGRGEERAALLSRYLGFPIWDVLIFPIVALAELPQLTPIKVTRFSPIDATALKPLDEKGRPERGGHKLKGRVLHHFGGFFDKEWRENDYLWGRLDGVELILKMLSEESNVVLPDSLRDGGFRKILQGEQTVLTEAAEVISDLLASLPPAIA